MSSSPFTATKVRIRSMVKEDLRAVLEIERKSGSEDLWMGPAFLSTLGRKKRGALVAVEGKEVLGFVCYQTYKTVNVILNLSVRPSVRRQGIATLLTNYLMTALGSRIRPILATHVRESNLSAQRFLKHFGFFCKRISKKHYKYPPEDAYIFEYSLPS